MKIDKSELPYQIIFALYLIGLIASEFMYVAFWIGTCLLVWRICFAIAWMWRKISE